MSMLCGQRAREPYVARTGSPSRQGLSLVETLISSTLVGVVIAVSLATSASVLRSGRSNQDLVLAQQLAHSMIDEILAVDEVIAIAAPDPLPGRSGFTAVDHYDGWMATPPTDREGRPLAGFSGWSRYVKVLSVKQDDLGRRPKNDEGVRRVDVIVEHNGVTVAATAVRSDAWNGLLPDAEREQTTPWISPVNEAPTARIVLSQVVGTGTLAVECDGRESTDPEGEVLGYRWEFGDGSAATGATVSHTFTNSGNADRQYSIRLIVSDPFGAVDVSERMVAVMASD